MGVPLAAVRAQRGGEKGIWGQGTPGPCRGGNCQRIPTFVINWCKKLRFLACLFAIPPTFLIFHYAIRAYPIYIYICPHNLRKKTRRHMMRGSHLGRGSRTSDVRMICNKEKIFIIIKKDVDLEH